MLADTAFIAHADRHIFQPWALDHGEAGSMGAHVRNPGASDEANLPSKGGPLMFKAGDMLRAQTAGAGGLGDTARRDPARLAIDLADGKVTEAQARKFYPAKLVEDALTRAREL